MTHAELQKKLGLYAENRTIIKLDPKQVPKELQDLIHLAEKWGIGDDIIRFDFCKKSSISDKNELVEKLNGRLPQIQKWLDEGSFNEERAAFMYMLSAYEEVQLI